MAVRNVVEGLPEAAKVGFVTDEFEAILAQELTFEGSKVSDDLYRCDGAFPPRSW